MNGTDPVEIPPENTQPATTVAERDLGTRIFLGSLFLVACFYAAILIYHSANPIQELTKSEGFLERCRQICLRYGLVSTGNVRRDAESYIQVVQPSQLTSGLSEILSSPGFEPAPSATSTLLNQPAPDFTLPDDSQTPRQLSQLAKNRPLVVVFYLGYGCSHCVAQLVSLERDFHYFRELDADIIAISADSPQHTTERFAEYGRFGFNVLSDGDHSVSEQWGVFHPATDDADQWMDHGTFVLDRHGSVIWSRTGSEPWLDNKTLLHVIAKSQGLLPDTVASTK